MSSVHFKVSRLINLQDLMLLSSALQLISEEACQSSATAFSKDNDRGTDGSDCLSQPSILQYLLVLGQHMSQIINPFMVCFFLQN